MEKENIILFLTKDSENGGEAIFIKKIIPILNKNKFKTKIISIIGKGVSKKDNKVFLNSKIFLNETIPSLREYTKLKKNIDNSDIFIIFPYGLQSLFHYLPLILKKKPIISTFHIGIVGRVSMKYLYEVFTKFLLINFSTIFSKKIIFITKIQEKNFRRYCIMKKSFDKKSCFVYDFIEKKLILNKRESKSDNKLIFVGRLKKTKGFDDLIDLIKKIGKEYNFIIVGKGKLSKNIPRYQNVNYISSIDNNKIINYYDKSDILIFPSYSETFGLVILEAMARGLVVLASDLPAIREYFIDGRNGYLFPPGDVEKMKEIILYLKNNPKEVERISKNNLKDIHKFTAEKQVPKYIKIYKEVMNEK